MQVRRTTLDTSVRRGTGWRGPNPGIPDCFYQGKRSANGRMQAVCKRKATRAPCPLPVVPRSVDQRGATAPQRTAPALRGGRLAHISGWAVLSGVYEVLTSG